MAPSLNNKLLKLEPTLDTTPLLYSNKATHNHYRAIKNN